MVNTSDSGSRSRGFEPHSGSHAVSLSKTYLLPPPPKKKKRKKKVLVIPGKRWLRPNMTEKLFTATLSINQTKTADWLMHNLTDFLFYTGVNGVITYTNRLVNIILKLGTSSAKAQAIATSEPALGIF